MSYQKKSLILQELEQAIRKKAQEKSRNKEQVKYHRALQGSIEKKKNAPRTATNKDARVASIHKNTDTASKHTLDKPLSIFNNEHLNATDATEFKPKKYNNRRLDKLVSLIQYMVSSSEKALRYISSNNFEAEFALKLYRSDRENLVNELKNLNLDDIMDSQRTYEKAAKPDQAYTLLLDENNKLKKEILILEKEAESYHAKHKDSGAAEGRQHERESNKLREMLRKLMPFEGFKQVLEILEKENKFEIMAIKSQENSKKTTEIEIVLSSLENERANIIETTAKGRGEGREGRTDRAYKLNEIQSEKEQLQRELAQMKVKLNEIMESGKSITELELHKKNSELLTEKLTALHRELSPNAHAKRNNEQIVDHIRALLLNLQHKNQQLTQTATHLTQENESLKEDVERLKEEKKELESDARSEGDEARMENMLSEIEKLRDIVEELGRGQEISSSRIAELEERVSAKEEEAAELASQLSEAVEKANQFKAIISELNTEIVQVQNEFDRTIADNAALREKLRVTQTEMIGNGYSKEELKTVLGEKEALMKKLETASHRTNGLEDQIKELESELIEKSDELEEMADRIDKENAAFKKAELKAAENAKELNSLKQQLEAVRAQKTTIEKMLEQHRQKATADIKELTTKLHQAELLNIKIGEEKAAAEEELETRMESIDSLTKKIEILEEEVRELQDEIRSLTVLSNSAAEEREHSREVLSHLQSQKEYLQGELSSAKQQMEDHSEIVRSRNRHYVNLLRQILKGLLLDPNDYAHKDNFEELLEFGSQQVVQLRKRQREEESNKRRNSKRDYEGVLTDFNDEQSLGDCKARLFEGPTDAFEKKQKEEARGEQKEEEEKEEAREEEVEIDEFNELRDQPNSSMISEDNHDPQQHEHSDPQKPEEGLLLEEFNDHEDGMGESMISNSEPIDELPEKLDLDSSPQIHSQKRLSDSSENRLAAQLPEQLSLHSLPHSSERESAEAAQLPEKLSLNSLKRRSQEEPEQSEEVQAAEQLPDKLSINSVHQDNKEEHEQTEERFNRNGLTTSEVGQFQEKNISQFNELEEHATESMLSEQPIEIKVSLLKQRRDEGDGENGSNLNEAKEDGENMLDGLDNGSMFFQPDFHLDVSKLKKFKQSREPQGYSKHTLLSIALRDEKLDLDEFEEVKSMEGNHSFLSNSENPDSHRNYVFHKKEEAEEAEEAEEREEAQREEGGLGASDVQMMTLDLRQSSNSAASAEMNIEEFGEMEADPMSQSMVSQEEQQEGQDEHNIEEFGEVAEAGLSESMISTHEQHDLPKDSLAESKQAELGLEEFGEVQERMNSSMLSEQSEHGLSEFGEVQEERMNESLLSERNKEEPEGKDEHGMSEFGEVQEDGMNDSLLSENYNLQLSDRQKATLDEFEEFKEEKMGDSMISQGVIARLKSDESEDS